MQGIIFDLDETLLDRSAAVRDFASGLFEEFLAGGVISSDAFLARVIQHDRHGYAKREDFFQLLYGEFRQQLPSDKVIKDAFYGQVWQKPVVAAGVFDCLSRLRKGDVPLGIVTNGGSEAQSNKIENSGLKEFFDVVVVSETFGSKKPEPSIYLEASNRLGIEPRMSWFVGDHPRNDIWGSKQLAFKTAWIHLNRPWPADLSPCYDLKGATFDETVSPLVKAWTDV